MLTVCSISRIRVLCLCLYSFSDDPFGVDISKEASMPAFHFCVLTTTESRAEIWRQ